MEEIDLSELFSYFLSKFYIIIITTLVFLMIGLGYTFLIKTPLYSSDSTVILVNKSSQSSLGTIQSDITTNQKLVSTYRELVKSRRILRHVIDELKLGYTAEQLQKMVSVESVKETELIKITVSSKDPEEAYNIAKETVRVFQDEIMKIYNLENVSIIDEAKVSNSPYNMNTIKDIIIYIMLGIVVSCAIIFIIYYFDNSVKSVEQVEKILGIPVIGTVPVLGKKVNK